MGYLSTIAEESGDCELPEEVMPTAHRSFLSPVSETLCPTAANLMKKLDSQMANDGDNDKGNNVDSKVPGGTNKYSKVE